MKITIAAFLFFVFSSFSFLAEYLTDEGNTENENQLTKKVSLDNQFIKSNSETESTYKIDVNLDEIQKSIFVSGSICWINKSDNSLNEILMNIPANTDKKSNINYKINFNTMFEEYGYEVLPIESNLFIDSSLVRIKLNDELKKGDTLKFNFNYAISFLTKSLWGENLFLQFENWYPQIGVYLSDQFQVFPEHKYIKTFSEFSKFNLNISVPKQFSVAAPGIEEKIDVNERRIIKCEINKIPSFNWLLFNNYIEAKSKIDLKENVIDLSIYVQKGNENNIERYSNAIYKYFTQLSDYFEYPYSYLTICELPQNLNLPEKSFPSILVTNAKIISPVVSQNLEYKIASLLSEQFFGNIVSTNNYSEAWLSKGVSGYLAEKLVRKEFGELYSFFNLAKYYPVKGLHFLSYNDLPLIYTIGEQVIPEGARFINEYYKNTTYSNLADTSYHLPNYQAFRVGAVVKPQLSLLILEKFIGSEQLLDNLSIYFHKYSYQHPSSNQLLEILTSGCRNECETFVHDLFKTGKRFDYAIKQIKEISDCEYELLVERREEGITPIIINIYTDQDTLYLNWDGKNNFKRFTFYSENKVLSAELDPSRENILDINFSNNSYVIESKYMGSVSFAVQIFFWFQNALMIIGSIG